MNIACCLLSKCSCFIEHYSRLYQCYDYRDLFWEVSKLQAKKPLKIHQSWTHILLWEISSRSSLLLWRRVSNSMALFFVFAFFGFQVIQFEPLLFLSKLFYYQTMETIFDSNLLSLWFWFHFVSWFDYFNSLSGTVKCSQSLCSQRIFLW